MLWPAKKGCSIHVGQDELFGPCSRSTHHGSARLTVVLVQVGAAVTELMVGPAADLVVLGNRYGGIEDKVRPAGGFVLG